MTIDEIREHCKCAKAEGASLHWTVTETCMAEIDNLQEQLANEKEKNRWIPVGERLPEGPGVWLVLHNGTPESYRQNDNSVLWRGFAETYTHWRPITLPKGEQSC